MNPVRITVAGSVNLDLVARCPRLPQAGETVLGGSFAQHPGGKGANQALAARRLGANVEMIACVGDDAHAEAALALLKLDGVGLSGCRTLPDVSTGVALIAVGEDGENQIVVAPGANAGLTPADIPDRIDGALLAQLEIPVDTVLRAAQVTTGLVALNLAPALPVPDTLLACAGLVIVNETEAAAYGRDRLFAPERLTAITLGAAGAELYRGTGRIARSRPPRVTVVDTTGAGDTAAAALLVALEEGREPQAALDFACAAGALAVTREGAQTSLPRRAEVDASG